MSTVPRSSLRLFSPDSSPTPDQPSARWTLLQFYERWVLPQVRRGPRPVSELTIQRDRVALGHWRSLAGDPPLDSITQETCNEFSLRLRNLPVYGRRERSPNTVRTTCTHLQTLLNYAGPRRRGDSQAAAILVEVPYLMRPEAVETRLMDVWRLEEVGQVLTACLAARQTPNLCGVPAAEWWQALILFAYNTGLRRETLLRATWEMVDRDEAQWITIPRQCMKGGKRGHRLYLNRWAREAIEPLQVFRNGRAELFPWRNWAGSKTWFGRCLGVILAASDVAPHRRFKMHALRGACGSELSKIDPTAADLVLGHRTSIRVQSYIDPHYMVEALNRLPQPLYTTQRRLF